MYYVDQYQCLFFPAAINTKEMPRCPDDYFSNWMEVAQDKGLQLLFNYVDRDIRHCAHTYTHIHLPAHTINRSRGSVGKKKKALLRQSDTRRICLLLGWVYLTADAIGDGLVWFSLNGLVRGRQLVEDESKDFFLSHPSHTAMKRSVFKTRRSSKQQAAARQAVGRSPTHGATWSRPDQAADDAPSKGL